MSQQNWPFGLMLTDSETAKLSRDLLCVPKTQYGHNTEYENETIQYSSKQMHYFSVCLPPMVDVVLSFPIIVYLWTCVAKS